MTFVVGQTNHARRRSLFVLIGGLLTCAALASAGNLGGIQLGGKGDDAAISLTDSLSKLPNSEPAKTCKTEAGSFPIAIQIPRGRPCTATTPNGAVQGVTE